MQFQRERKRDRSYKSFLFQLKKTLSAEQLDQFFPGLKQRIDGHSPSSNVSRTRSDGVSGGSPVIRSKTKLPSRYNQMKSFLDPKSNEYAKRLNKGLNHRRTTSMTTKEETKTVKVRPNELFDASNDEEEKEITFQRRPRRNCVMCCVHCSIDKPSNEQHTRVGRRMNQFCSVCQVYICDDCWDKFHNEPVPGLPPCVSSKYNTAVQTRSNTSSCPPCPSVSSPVRVSRPRRMQSLQNSPIRRLNQRRRQRASGLDEADVVDALQILSGRTKRSNPQQPPAPRKRRRRGS